MNSIEDLIQVTLLLTKRLEIAAADEKKFNDNIQHELELMSWESYKMANDLNEIKKYIS